MTEKDNPIMEDIREVLKKIELHDSALECITVKGDGSAELYLDIDDVWNEYRDPAVTGIRLLSVYEVSDLKIER
ncbi:hypothetical protein N9V90_01545 [Endozoicomonas sp.]|nr:hypothetical protein [Endozoicomonas sp.]